ncbi:MAG TPA: methylmalonyl Co-A mutase-associated GTPase MeaB, partial [Polyangia bacterium]|nr:methylmalonyl Co-A mutase-associated GTPase MeaB [Polyangia bacterium]
MAGGDLVERALGGDLRAAATLMRALDDELPGAREALRAIYPRGGQAFVVGVTGSAGVGKSTLVGALVAAYRARGERVAVVAVDPSSPFSGGALLGDRVRMNRHATDDGVFIRSLATRGQQGGLSRATSATVAVLDAVGFPVIFVETVGAGQAEIDVADAADAVVVATAPGLGDEVQALKAGLLEIADVLVVNKGDRDGADRAVADLRAMLALGAR